MRRPVAERRAPTLRPADFGELPAADFAAAGLPAGNPAGLPAGTLRPLAEPAALPPLPGRTRAAPLARCGATTFGSVGAIGSIGWIASAADSTGPRTGTGPALVAATAASSTAAARRD